MSSDDSEKSKGKNYLAKTFQAVIFITLVKWLWPWALPYEVFSFWSFKTPLIDGILAAWPCFAWAVGIQTALELLRGRASSFERLFMTSGHEVLVKGFWVSLWAGTVEEICFRWLLFLQAIISVKVANFLIFDWLGWGFFRWLHENVAGPVADFTTFYGLHDKLFHSSGWAFGAGLLAANALFREGHTYQGWFGVINSWFLGMFFFWMMFTHGLVAAIIAHILYDMLIFTVVAVFRVVRD